MPENLLIENVSDLVADLLRERAKLHRRSLQDELLAIIEAAVREESQNAAPPGFAEEQQAPFQAPPREASQLEQVLEQVRTLPDDRRQEVAQVLLAYLNEESSDIRLSPEQIAEIERCMSDDEPFASEEEAREVFAHLTK
jgi:plasmid stability protein